MKENIVRALLVLMVMFSGIVSANDIRFQKTVTDNLESFRTSLVEDGAIVGDKVNIGIIAEYAYATDKSLLPEGMTKEEYEAAFRTKNGFKDEMIPFATFYTQAKAGKVLSPFGGVPASATQANSTTFPQTPMSVAFVSNEDDAVLRRLQKEIADLQKQIVRDKVEARGSDTQLANLHGRRLDELNVKLEAINKMVNDQNGQLEKGLPDTAKLQALATQVTALSSEFDEVRKLKSVQQEHGKSISMLWLAVVGGLVSLGLVTFALHFFTHRRVTAVAEESVAMRNSVQRTVNNLDEEVEDVRDRVTSLEDKLLPGTTLLMTRDEATVLADWLSSRAVGAEHTHICRLQDGTQYRVRFTRASGEYVTIRGIRDQQENNQVGIRKVPTRLRTAAKNGQFTDKWMLEVVAQAA